MISNNISSQSKSATSVSPSKNSVEFFANIAKQKPRDLALHLLENNSSITYHELLDIACLTQSLCRSQAVRKGDGVLLLNKVGPELYGAIIGILGLGCHVIMVEPWLGVDRIQHVIAACKPKLFLSPWWGQLWGSRVQAIREIPNWRRFTQLIGHSKSDFTVEEVSDNDLGLVAFTSGTSGAPKGVVRTQGYLKSSHQILGRELEFEKYQNADLCIFPAFALINLAWGKPTVFFPSRWKPKYFQALHQLGDHLRPQSLTCGPGFLLELLRSLPKKSALSELESLHVGGALTDNWIFEEAQKTFPKAQMSHVYGSSEAEPVCVGPLKESLTESQTKGYFQCLHLGRPIPEIESNVEESQTWITGPHVCKEYLGGTEENRIHKRMDSVGRIWHAMGDRIQTENNGWWYAGRSFQKASDFQLEQSIYSLLQSSKCFVHRVGERRLLIGEGVSKRELEIRSKFSQIDQVIETKIRRDARHRARIDRVATASLKLIKENL